VNGYGAVLRARFVSLLQYRAAAAAGIITQVFWGFIKIMILEAFYGSSAATQPMSFPEVVTYVWLGQAFLGMLPWNVDKDAQQMVRDGSVAYELLRPLDTYWLWFSRTLALRTAPTLLRSVPLAGIAAFVVPLVGLREWALLPPADLSTGVAWLVSMVLALLLACSITTLMNTTLMWTISGVGLTTMLPSLVTVLSGMIVPLPLFPPALRTLCMVLPFRGVADTPYRVYSGHLAGADIIGATVHQIGWIVLLVLVGRAVMQRGLHRVVIQGG
jgi:ABC-2 type transport system permease protein